MAATRAARATRLSSRSNATTSKTCGSHGSGSRTALLPNPQGTSETTPIMVNGVVYFSMDQKRFVVAADAATGETIWIYRPDEGARFDGAPRKIHRGVSYWTDGRGDERIIFATPGFHLIALNAKTGAPVPGFGTNGIVDMMKDLDIDFKGDPNGKIGNSSPVVISNDVIVVGPAHLRPTRTNVKGDVLAYDVRSRQKEMDLPHDSSKGRTRLRDLAEWLRRVHGKRRCLGTVLRRSGIGIRLSQHRSTDQ